MTSIRRLENRLRAWESFRGIARASRALAAAQAMTWSSHATQAEAALARSLALSERTDPGPDAPRVLLGIGTDVGLCGSVNAAVAREVSAQTDPHVVSRVLVGSRLSGRAAPHEPTLTVATPTSLAAVASATAHIEGALASLDPSNTRLVVVSVREVGPDGVPRVAVTDEPTEPPASLSALHATLSEPAHLRREAAALVRHFRIADALVRAICSEHEARWRTMNRAHDAAERSIEEQGRTLRKRTQEAITQELLDARR